MARVRVGAALAIGVVLTGGAVLSDQAAARRQRAPAGGSTSPAGPPLISATTVPGPQGGDTGGDEPGAGGSPQAELDPLVSNGLGSPLCSGALGGSGLDGASKSHCETSGFIAAAAPTGNFGIDVHIDTGFLGLSSAGLLAIVQDLFVTPVWMALVWAVHALVVMLEWCFAIDLLDSPSVSSGIARGLRNMQSAITAPWLATVLAIASVLCAYNGLVRRRVAESVAQALLVLAMIAAGTWVMVDPAGTVGALGAWANQASLGTLAVTAQGDPSDPDGALAGGMDAVFSAAVEVPWCYMEFGDVDWCRSPSRLEPQLRTAALALARTELESVGCSAAEAPSGATTSGSPCAAKGGADAKALERSARLLRTARTNGAIFLALPPNGPARNAINDSSSLLRAICRSDDATSCRGPAAAQAEFRTNRGTWPRVGGLLLIVLGVLGMLLLLGFLALRLLGSAIFSLLYLLLAPAAALAPALGEAGRAAFRKWAAHLLAAVVSKLLFALVLGVVLAVLGLLEHLESLGWWTRWLLMSAFWWGLFVRRHQALQLAGGDRTPGRAHGFGTVRRGLNDALDARAGAQRRVREAKERFAKRAPQLGAGASVARRPSPRPGTGSPDSSGSRDPTGSVESAGRVRLPSLPRGEPRKTGAEPEAVRDPMRMPDVDGSGRLGRSPAEPGGASAQVSMGLALTPPSAKSAWSAWPISGGRRWPWATSAASCG
ncbi:MAG TPA: hypothetical protein VHW67_02550 [Solirubrobacteraceae bacterium]|nr:hypothetical protein [Solirubrobacteraceae bacterium]